MVRLRIGVVAAFLASAIAGCGPGESSSTEAPRIEASEIAEILANSNVVFLDVREAEEIEELGTIEGYVHIPIDELADRLGELPKDKPILTA